MPSYTAKASNVAALPKANVKRRSKLPKIAPVKQPQRLTHRLPANWGSEVGVWTVTGASGFLNVSYWAVSGVIPILTVPLAISAEIIGTLYAEKLFAARSIVRAVTTGAVLASAVLINVVGGTRAIEHYDDAGAAPAREYARKVSDAEKELAEVKGVVLTPIPTCACPQTIATVAVIREKEAAARLEGIEGAKRRLQAVRLEGGANTAQVKTSLTDLSIWLIAAIEIIKIFGRAMARKATGQTFTGQREAASVAGSNLAHHRYGNRK